QNAAASGRSRVSSSCETIEQTGERIAPVGLHIEHRQPDLPRPGLRLGERSENARAFVWLDVPSHDDAQLWTARPHLGGASFSRPQLHLDPVEEVSYRFRRGTVTVTKLLPQSSEVVQHGEPGDPAVELELALAAGDVVVRDGRRKRQVDRDLTESRGPRGPPLLVHGLLEEPGIELEADRGDVAMLLGAEDVPRATDLQVVHGDLEPGTQLARFED